MRILYLACSYDPLIQSDGSSADYDLYHAFLRGGATLQIVGPFNAVPSFVEKIYRKLHRLFSRRRYSKHSLAFLRLNSREINRAIDEFSPDVLFTYFYYPLVYLKTEIPIVYGIDTTVIGSQGQWPLFSRVEYLRMLNWERSVLRRSAAVITWSKWTADILKDRYGIAEERISYFPRPASLPPSCIPEHLELYENPLSPLNLLLVGRDKERKGVSLAVELVNKLNKMGMVTNLRIVGLDGQNTEYVKYCGLYNKSIDSQLKKYVGHYQWSHFLIHPAKFEAAGIVPSEAAAFGVPKKLICHPYLLSDSMI
jgi:glycosyltransferase involved in cell wall biosynthesis